MFVGERRDNVIKLIRSRADLTSESELIPKVVESVTYRPIAAGHRVHLLASSQIAGGGSWRRSSGPTPNRPRQDRQTSGIAGQIPAATSIVVPSECRRRPAATSPEAASPVQSRAVQSPCKAPQKPSIDRPAQRSQSPGSSVRDGPDEPALQGPRN